MAQRAFKIRGMDCAEEVAALKKTVGSVVGSEDRLSFDLLSAKMMVDAPDAVDDSAIERAVRVAGLDAIAWEAFLSLSSASSSPGFWQTHSRAILCVASGTLIAVGLIAHIALEGLRAALEGAGATPLFLIVFHLGAIIAGGWYISPKAWAAVRRLRPDMNLLMTVAVIGAVFIGQWLEAATVTFLFSLALLLESWSVNHARQAIRALLDISPKIARCVCPHDGDIEEKPVEDVAPGAIVSVRPGDRIPLDGVVTKGTTSVNQAPITGESVPVHKGPGEEVFAGTVNNEGAFEFKVTRAVNDTTLARIIHMVEEAQSRRAPSERWVERFARYYTPGMMFLAILIAVVPPWVQGGNWDRWFYEGLVILVIACPCALVISTPVSIVAGLAHAARHGVLIKGGLYIELPAQLKAIALDKTGTLTFGRPEIQKIVPLPGHSAEELLQRAASVESLSHHPLARAVVRRAEQEGVAFSRAETFEAIGGKGAEAQLDGRDFWLGSHRFSHERGVECPEAHAQAETLEDAGHSVVFMGTEDHVCGLISIADEIRPETSAVLGELRAAGIKYITMLTGDNEGTAKAVAAAAGVDAYEAELLPEDKVRAIEALVRDHGSAAMVGDGVNDAPAMAAATLGIAMGAAGSDAAIETADIALMSDDLGKLAWLIRHSRRTMAIIKQNVTAALAVKAVFVASALAGVATLWMAIAADMGASLLVIFNALRLLQEKRA